MPGGDDFGARPIDMHIAALEAMGAEFKLAHGELHARAERLHGADIVLPFPSVGATENIVTAAVLANGTTVLDNAAREPEVVDLCEMLVAMGAEHRPASARRRIVDRGRRARRAATGGPPHGVPTASRPPPTSPRSPSPAASSR